MIKHYLREFLDLGNYGIVGLGTTPAKLETLVFDAADWSVSGFIVSDDSTAGEPVKLTPSMFRSIDDEARLLHFDTSVEAIVEWAPSSGVGEATTLYDARELLDRDINGTDVTAGRIVDLLVNVNLWQMRYFVIDTGGRRVLTDIEWASSLSRGTAQPAIDLPGKAVATAPAYEHLDELCSGYEEALYRHYTRRVYATNAGGLV